MPWCVGPPDRSPNRPRALLLGAGVLACSLALPATLVTAEEKAPAIGPNARLSVVHADELPEKQPNEGTQPAVGATPAPGESTSPEPIAPATGAAPVPTVASSPSAAASSSASVSIVGSDPDSYGFSPASITIQAGTTVTWNNASSAPEGHTVSGSGLESGTLHQGQSYSHSFGSPGTFSYICSIHPYMKGAVTVRGGSSGGSASQGGATPSGTPATPVGPGSESAAGASPGAAGSAAQLPSTGIPLVPLLGVGGGLLALGALARRRAAVS